MAHRGGDRRRNKRFDVVSTGSKLARIERGGRSLTLKDCELVNLSFGGMCFRSTEELEPEGQYDFLILLRAPLQELVFVRSDIRWLHSADSSGWMIGAAIVESSRDWLGAFNHHIH
jgi:hypothetical protein